MTTIVRSEDVLGGDPRIDGTRVGVLHVHELVIEGDHNPADVADQLELPLEAVYTALASYYGHSEEMRDIRQAHGAADVTLVDRSLKPPTSW